MKFPVILPRAIQLSAVGDPRSGPADDSKNPRSKGVGL